MDGIKNEMFWNRLVPSAEPALMKRESINNFPELWSSQGSDFYPAVQRRMSRVFAFSAVTVPVTVYSTVTSFSFSTTVVKKTINVGALNGLSCLPSGYAVC